MDELQIVVAINKARKGIEQYLEIMSLLPDVDVSQDRDFQRKYNAFYRMRQRSREWYDLYFAYLENGKAKAPSFSDTLSYFYTELGRYEPSFSSKLVATLDPHQPVWDRFVLENIVQTAPRYGAENRVEEATVVYRNIQEWYQKYLASEEGQNAISIFNREVADYRRITDLKKIDFILWKTRK